MIHVNMGSNRYPNDDHEECWMCGEVPDVLAYTYFGAPTCKDCWDNNWRKTEDGETDPPFDNIHNSFWLNTDESEAPDA